MSQVTHLASGALNRSGDTISIDLHQPLDSPSFVMVVWPTRPSVTAATPKALAALAAAMVRTLAEAQAELVTKIRNSQCQQANGVIARADRANQDLRRLPLTDPPSLKLRGRRWSPPRTPGKHSTACSAGSAKRRISTSHRGAAAVCKAESINDLV